MSTILKALRRLERDRKQAEGQRPLREEIAEIRPGVPLERSSTRTVWWVGAAGVGLIGVLVLALGWPRLVRETEEPAALARVTPSAGQLPATTAPVRQQPASRVAPNRGRSAPRAASGSPAPAPVRPRGEARSDPPVAPPAAPQASSSAPPRKSPTPAAEVRSEPSGSGAPARSLPAPPVTREGVVERASPERRTAPSPVLARTPSPSRPADPPSVEPAPRETEPPPTHSSPEPKASPPTPTARAEKAAPPPPAPASPKPSPKTEPPAPPEVLVERTVWHPDASRRRAFLRIPGLESPASLREGDSAGTLVVLRIEPSGVVFLHEGRELRRAVGQGG